MNEHNTHNVHQILSLDNQQRFGKELKQHIKPLLVES